MSHQSQLVKNTAIIAIGKMSTQVLSYLLLPLFSSRMQVSDYGIYDFVCTIHLFLCPIISLLIEEAMFRFLIDAETKKQKKDVISQTIIFTLIGSLIFIPLAIIILNSCTNYSGSLIFVFIMFVLSNIIINLSNAFARGLGEIKTYSISNVILGISTIALQIGMLLIKPSAEGLLWVDTAANILTSIYLFKKLHVGKYIGRLKKSLMKKMLKYSMPLVPNSISWAIINMSDRIVLTNMVGEEANGIYAMANRFPNIIISLYSYFALAWKESASKIIKDEKKAKHYNEIYHDVKKLMYSTTLCLIAVMPFVFPIFINKRYEESYIYIPIIMLAMYYSCMSNFYGGIFTAFKETKIMGITTFIAAAINLIIDLLLVNSIGIYAACISTIVADLVVYLYRKYKLRSYIKLKEINLFGPILIMTLVCFAYYTKFIPGFGEKGYWVLNAITCLIAILYSIAINYNFIKKIINRIKDRFTHKNNLKEES